MQCLNTSALFVPYSWSLLRAGVQRERGGEGDELLQDATSVCDTTLKEDTSYQSVSHGGLHLCARVQDPHGVDGGRDPSLMGQAV